ncbi:phosphoesterase PA-phosphatase, partial [Dickeya dadantii]
RFVPLIDRAATYGYSRLVLGVHYPLDVIGGRMAAERSVAHILNDPAYRVLFNEAKTQLRAALEKACGTALAECAKPQGKNDPYTDPAMKSFYRYTMTYHLPEAIVEALPLKVPEGAEVLLEGPLPQLSAAQR